MISIFVILESAWKSAKKSNYETRSRSTKPSESSLKKRNAGRANLMEMALSSRLRLHLDVADHDSRIGTGTQEISERMNKHVKAGVDHNPRNTLRIYYDIKRKDSVRIAYCEHY